MDAETAKLLDQLSVHTLRLVQDPTAPVHAELGEVYLGLGRLQDALAIVEEGTRLHPSYGPGFAMLGRLRLAAKDLQGAERSLEKALSLTTADSDLLYDLATVKFQLDRKQDCRVLLERLLAAEPEHPEAKALLARLAPVGEVSAPQEGAGAKKPFATATLAEIYVKQGYLNRALQVYEQLAAGEPQNEKLQQRVVELRRQVDVETATPPAGKTAEQPVGQSEAPPQTEALQGEVAQPPVREEEPGLRIVQELERWLRAIARRRADVR